MSVTLSPDWKSAAAPWSTAISSAPCLASCSSSQADTSGLESCSSVYTSSAAVLESKASTVSDGAGMTEVFVSKNEARFTLFSCICEQATVFSPFLEGTTTGVCTANCGLANATVIANAANAYSVLCDSVLNYTPASTTESTTETETETASSETKTTTSSKGATTTSSSSAAGETGSNGGGSDGVSGKVVTLTGVLLGALLGVAMVM